MPAGPPIRAETRLGEEGQKEGKKEGKKEGEKDGAVDTSRRVVKP
jgi:hypothetical protein